MTGPPQPPVQFRLRFPDILDLQEQAQGLLHTVRTVEAAVIFGDHGDPGLLVLCETLRSFPQSKSRVLDCLRLCFGGCNDLCDTSRRTSSSASIAHSTTWKGSIQRSQEGVNSFTQSVIHLAPSPVTTCILESCLGVSWR